MELLPVYHYFYDGRVEVEPTSPRLIIITIITLFTFVSLDMAGVRSSNLCRPTFSRGFRNNMLIRQLVIASSCRYCNHAIFTLQLATSYDGRCCKISLSYSIVSSPHINSLIFLLSLYRM